MQYILFDGKSSVNEDDWFEELYEFEDTVTDTEIWDIAGALSVEHNQDPDCDHIGWERLSKAEAEEWALQMEKDN